MPPLKYTALDIITDALIETNIQAPGDPVDAETGQWAFRQLNYLIDTWQAKKAYVFAQQFQLFTLVPALSPHTIGPNPTPPAVIPVPTFSTGNQPRPVKIVGAALILNTGTGPQVVDLPMNIRDEAWWRLQQTKEIQTNVPTDLYYQPDNPLGSCFFWPVPSSASQVRLEFWQALSQYSQINDPLAGPGAGGTLPEGYRSALTFTLAEMLCPGAAKELHQVLAQKGIEARKAIFGNNSASPRIATQDFGMPRSGRTRPDFNWATGGYPGGPPE